MINVVFIGIGKNTPTFIDRRVRELFDHEGIVLRIVMEDGVQVPYNEGSLIRLPNTTKFNFRMVICTFWRIITHFSSLIRLYKIKKDVSTWSRVKWAVKMLPLTHIGKVDIIHLQWILFANEYDWLKLFYDCKIVASARGAQVTIQPTLNESRLHQIVKAFQKADAIHCVSNDILKQCIKWGARENRLKVIYNGVNTSFFRPHKSKREGVDFVLTSVGALVWRKGYLYQLLLVKMLKDAGLKVRLNIVGSGEEWESIQYAILKLELSNEILLMGKKSSDEIADILRHTDIYISTSIAEGLSNSVVEAASTGIPCFVFECEGMNEIIETGKTGYVFQFGDIQAMHKKILEIITDSGREELRNMGLHAREHVLLNFEESNCTDNLISFYRDICIKTI